MNTNMFEMALIVASVEDPETLRIALEEKGAKDEQIDEFVDFLEEYKELRVYPNFILELKNEKELKAMYSNVMSNVELTKEEKDANLEKINLYLKPTESVDKALKLIEESAAELPKLD